MLGENAVLLEINAPGAQDAYGDVAAAGATLWTGRAKCYLKRASHETFHDGLADHQRTDVLYVRRAAGAPPVETSGIQPDASTVLVEDRRDKTPVTTRLRVYDVSNRAGETIADSIRMVLGDERLS